VTGYAIRLLTRSDEPAFRRVRLDALRLHPTAFGATYDSDARTPPDELASRLLEPPSLMFGGITTGGMLVGTTALRLQTSIKSRHKGSVFAVYVDAAHRGTGLARALLEAAIARARDEHLKVVQLTVTVGNDAARRLYAEFGFRTYGIERRGLCVDGVFLDEELMAFNLD
jgi:ribosomal protein S18 acetylase RimI-like enzyme